MDELTRKFNLENTRSAKGAITDVSGNLGNWPFRRTISYHIGVNCDAISTRDGQLYVKRRGRTIAIAEAPRPVSSVRRFLQLVRNTLHPRHARRQSGDGSRDTRWEDMLRSRRPK